MMRREHLQRWIFIRIFCLDGNIYLAMRIYFVMEPDSGIRDLILQLHHYAHGTRQWNKRLGTAITSLCTCLGAHV